MLGCLTAAAGGGGGARSGSGSRSGIGWLKGSGCSGGCGCNSGPAGCSVRGAVTGTAGGTTPGLYDASSVLAGAFPGAYGFPGISSRGISGTERSVISSRRAVEGGTGTRLSRVPKSRGAGRISHTISSGLNSLGPVPFLKPTLRDFPTGISTLQRLSPVRVSNSVTVLGCHDVLLYV